MELASSPCACMDALLRLPPMSKDMPVRLTGEFKLYVIKGVKVWRVWHEYHDNFEILMILMNYSFFPSVEWLCSITHL